MGDLLISLFPIALAGAVAPVLILPAIFLLGTRNPIRNASAFAVAALTTYTTLGAMILFVVGGQAAALGDGFSKTSTIVSIILGGIMLLLVPFQWRSATNQDESLSKRLQSLDFSGVGRAFGFGVVMPLFGAKNLIIYTACLSLITKSQMGTVNSLLAMSAILLIFSMQMLIPIAIYAAISERAARALVAIQNWVMKHSRIINLCANLFGGLFLLSKGLTDLLSVR